MGGLQHLFVTGVVAATDIHYIARTSKGLRHQNLYLPQSMLDSSCGLLCVLQAAMLLCGLRRTKVEGLTTAKRAPLRGLWRLAREAYFDGTSEAEIESYVNAFSPTLTCTTVTSQSAKRLGPMVAKAVRAGHVPMVRFDSQHWCHWAFVIGVESMAGESFPRALLLLDPSASQPWGSFYNARLELQTKAGASVRAKRPYTLPYRFVTGEAWAVRLNGLVIVKRGQSP
jgi:hypothetical protein